MRPSFHFCWMQIFPWIKLSWHSSSLWDKLGWLNRFWQFLCEGLSSFHSKRFYYSYAWSCSFCERSTSFCTGLITKKILCILTYVFWLALLHSASYFFFFDQLPSSLLCTVFDSISSNMDEVLSINPSANVFVCGDFNVH